MVADERKLIGLKRVKESLMMISFLISYPFLTFINSLVFFDQANDLPKTFTESESDIDRDASFRIGLILLISSFVSGLPRLYVVLVCYAFTDRLNC